ncbi:FadR family transcriptional regulator [Salinicoccus cyprini]|uniref:FadR family transcriptional regulator n=1 Tax=Salinicoccus cyprini TaxID=2493691 RepID=A0A558ASV0_9STAP|nr:FadR/GntR family transcriptional regulator [Salinicoccus cyprini]TVT27338.1 FadR family transcriptional regulator [Salinicoccus cyprini]
MGISRKKIYEEIADLIMQDIKDGVLNPGDQLPSITRMAEHYQVSSASIREALNTLSVMDVIEVKHGQGSYIKERMPLGFEHEFQIITRKDIENLLDLRKIIEVGCVELACSHADEEDLGRMQDALGKMRTAVMNNELGEQADYEFHMAIAQSTGNQMLVDLLGDVSEKMLETMKETRRIWLYEEKKSIQKIFDEHQAIYRAIAEKDSGNATGAMMRHLEEVATVLLKQHK